MSRSSSFGINGLVAQTVRAALLTALFAAFAASAVAQESIDNANPMLVGIYPEASVKGVAYTAPAPAGGQTDLSVQGVSYANPVIAGNYPDPSVIRVGPDYWATATSSGWAPQFPILHSRDLVNWEVVGSVFQKRPAWSNGNYWAPEITRYRGRYYVYYVGRKKDGPRCVAVATAKQPTGPYTDHGPLICQERASIDPMAVTDESGWPYLVWKEANPNQPTRIWAQRLTINGLGLIGERIELLHSDAAWETQVVEGPYILRRDGWFYMFYSGNDCCSPQCNYALGVARSPYLLGPWEKNPTNPILKGNETWKCPGHGSIVSDTQGRDHLLYHAYKRDAMYVGRQAMLDEVKWGANQWPTIGNGDGPSGLALSPYGIEALNAEYSFLDDFKSPSLTPGWQWPQANAPSTRIQQAPRGWLALSPTNARAQDVIGAVMARSTTAGDYVATTIAAISEMKPGALAGLAAYGDRENALGIAAGSGKVIVWRREKNAHEIVATVDVLNSPFVHLRMTATDGRRFRFAVSQDGQSWTEVGNEKGTYLPPWDHAVRVALTSGGIQGAVARFDSLQIVPSHEWQEQGEVVAQGDKLIDIETDKVSLEIAGADGDTVKEIRKNGAGVGSNEVIAVIDTEAGGLIANSAGKRRVPPVARTDGQVKTKRQATRAALPEA